MTGSDAVVIIATIFFCCNDNLKREGMGLFETKQKRSDFHSHPRWGKRWRINCAASKKRVSITGDWPSLSVQPVILIHQISHSAIPAVTVKSLGRRTSWKKWLRSTEQRCDWGHKIILIIESVFDVISTRLWRLRASRTDDQLERKLCKNCEKINNYDTQVNDNITNLVLDISQEE